MTEFKDIKKILIIKLRHIGDVLLTVPTIRAVRETFPQAYITALVNSGTEEMLTGNPLLNEVIVYDRGIKQLPLLKRVKGELKFLQEIRSKNFDMTIDLTSGDRGAICSYLSGARYRLAYDPKGKGFIGKRYLYTHLANHNRIPKHMVLQNLHLVRHFGMDTTNHSIEIFCSNEDEAFIDRLLGERGIGLEEPFIHIHPTSRWLFKCWKDEYMAEVIRWLIDKGIKIVVTSSPDKREIERAKRILSLVSPPTPYNPQLIDLCGKTTLKSLVALSKRSVLFFGVDSAPMHIAAAVGTPVIALFGPSEHILWSPWDGTSCRDYKVQESFTKNGKRYIIQYGKHRVIQYEGDEIVFKNNMKISTAMWKITVDDVTTILREFV